MGMRSVLFFLFFLVGCSTYVPPSSIVQQPLSVLPDRNAIGVANASGSIFALANGKGVFSDNKPTRVGDILTVVIADQSSASNNATNTASRSSDFKLNSTISGIGGRVGRFLNATDGTAFGSSADATGTGTSTANSNFTANITTTVTEVLPNGNLRIAGEKQVRINQEVQFLRISGVVSPKDILYNNTVGTLAVDSSKLADARIEHINKGSNSVFTGRGWLSEFINYINPF